MMRYFFFRFLHIIGLTLLRGTGAGQSRLRFTFGIPALSLLMIEKPILSF